MTDRHVRIIVISAIVICVALFFDIRNNMSIAHRIGEQRIVIEELRHANAELTTALAECRYQAERMQAAVELRDMTNNNAALDKLIEANR